MLVKMHGTSGSGKSTIARELMEKGEVIKLDHAYEVKMPGLDKSLFVLGLYNSACGGCDTLTAGQQIDLIHYYAPRGHVFYEGLLGSEYYGKLGEASERYGRKHVFAFIDTPIEVCIARVKHRRLEAGNNKPLNETNTRERVHKIQRLKMKLLMTKRHVVTVDHMHATQQVYDLYRNANAESETTG
jgi:predicted kinase